MVNKVSARAAKIRQYVEGSSFGKKKAAFAANTKIYVVDLSLRPFFTMANELRSTDLDVFEE